MIVGMIAIKALLKYVQNHSYLVFAIYRWIIAAGVIALFFAKGIWKI
jgi:undecaprenyl pyrophosphate phosphatase UppP